jgi:putative tryptophan/tyrosine transport system substrate-binding protein
LTVANPVCCRSGQGQRMHFHRLKRREFITLLGGVAAASPLAARAQPVERRQIAVWFGRANDAEGRRLGSAFREALQALGWTNGRNVRIDYRWVTSEIDRPSLAEEIAEQRPDVIVAETTSAVAALVQANSTTPIVFVNVSDPIGSGFVASLARPGGSVTGFISNEPTLGSKWPGLLKEIASTVQRIGFLFNPDTGSYAEPFLNQAKAAALSSALQVTPSPVRGDPEIERMVSAVASAPGGGLIVMPDAFTNTHSARIIELCAEHRLPAIYAYRFQAIGGGLIAYGVDLADSLRSAAGYVDRILKGEKPANLPVQVPTKFLLVINLNTAKALGLAVPDKLLALADEAIE